MKELVEVMAKSLVSNPSAVVVEEETTGTSTVLRLHVAPEDMGKEERHLFLPANIFKKL